MSATDWIGWAVITAVNVTLLLSAARAVRRNFALLDQCHAMAADPQAPLDVGQVDAIRAECDRLARAADRYDQAGQYEYAGGLREAAHHVSTLLSPGEMAR